VVEKSVGPTLEKRLWGETKDEAIGLGVYGSVGTVRLQPDGLGDDDGVPERAGDVLGVELCSEVPCDEVKRDSQGGTEYAWDCEGRDGEEDEQETDFEFPEEGGFARCSRGLDGCSLGGLGSGG
jgi:hypothetical protein